MMGKADWLWNEELGTHIPCCRMPNNRDLRQQTCGNGPLTGDQIETGDCGEHGIRRRASSLQKMTDPYEAAKEMP